MVHQLDLSTLLREVEIVLPVPRLVVESLEEVGHALRLVELGETLVHPGEPLLVRADHHREPHVADLVVHHLVHARACPTRPPMQVIIGYSIPPQESGPSTTDMWGQG